MKKLVALLFGWVVAIVGTELGMRLCFTALPHPVKSLLSPSLIERWAGASTYYTVDDRMGYRLKPNHTSHHALFLDRRDKAVDFEMRTIALPEYPRIGFRDEGVSRRPPWAVAVGDSFVFGYGVRAEEGWISLLEKKRGKTIFNMGCPAFSTVSEERMLVDYGLPLKPSLVLFGFTQNDFSDTAKFLQNQEMIRARATKHMAGLRDFLWNHSILYACLKALPSMMREKLHPPRPPIEEGGTVLLDEAYLRRNAALTQSGASTALQALDQAYAAAQAQGAHFVLILFPTKEHFYWEKSKNRLADPEETRRLMDYAYECIRTHAREKRIPVIDALALFPTYEDTPLFFNLDGHLNSQGQRVLARIVESALHRMGWMENRR